MSLSDTGKKLPIARRRINLHFFFITSLFKERILEKSESDISSYPIEKFRTGECYDDGHVKLISVTDTNQHRVMHPWHSNRKHSKQREAFI